MVELRIVGFGEHAPFPLTPPPVLSSNLSVPDVPVAAAVSATLPLLASKDLEFNVQQFIYILIDAYQALDVILLLPFSGRG